AAISVASVDAPEDLGDEPALNGVAVGRGLAGGLVVVAALGKVEEVEERSERICVPQRRDDHRLLPSRRFSAAKAASLFSTAFSMSRRMHLSSRVSSSGDFATLGGLPLRFGRRASSPPAR